MLYCRCVRFLEWIHKYLKSLSIMQTCPDHQTIVGLRTSTTTNFSFKPLKILSKGAHKMNSQQSSFYFYLTFKTHFTVTYITQTQSSFNLSESIS